MPSLSMNYPGDKAFAKLLDKTGCEISLVELRAFLMGCILSDELVMPHYALQMVLDNGPDDTPPFETEDAALEFMSGFTGLWNEMTGYQFSKVPFRFSRLPKSFASDQEFKQAIALRISEMCLFLDGVLQDGGEQGYAYDSEDLDSLPFTGIVDVLIQMLAGQLEAMGKKSHKSVDQGILLAMVEVADERFEKALKRHLKACGKGPGKGPAGPKARIH